jgi:hypothetical protein
MTLRRLFAALAVLPLAGCVTTVHAPERLIGQPFDAATALYGPWDARIERGGRPVYVWRRTIELADGERRSCELRVTLGFRNTIGTATLEGFQDACRMYDVRYETVTR